MRKTNFHNFLSRKNRHRVGIQIGFGKNHGESRTLGRFPTWVLSGLVGGRVEIVRKRLGMADPENWARASVVEIGQRWAVSHDLQHRPGLSVHVKSVDGSGGAIWHPSGHGWQGALDGSRFFERLWRSVKHEGGCLWAHETVQELEMATWFEDYNRLKPHQSLDRKTPWQCDCWQEVHPWRKVA
jgi:hypothetical protein